MAGGHSVLGHWTLLLLATRKVFNCVTSQYLQLVCKGSLALTLLDGSESSCCFPDAQDAVIYSAVHLYSMMRMLTCMET